MSIAASATAAPRVSAPRWPSRAPPGDYRQTQVGDASDTSPYPARTPAIGISTATYIANMARLIRALGERR